jgi:signal transduction histidine kinase/dsRNA-specific ribonuclease
MINEPSRLLQRADFDCEEVCMMSLPMPTWMRPARGIDANIVFPRVSITWDIAPVYEELSRCGLSAVDDNLHNGLLLALSHESFFYEHSREMTGVTAGLLNGLIRLGGNFVARAASIHFYRQRAFSRPGPLSNLIAVAMSSIPQWAGELEWLRQSASLGKSLDPIALPRRVSGNLYKQVLGVLCLAGHYQIANSLVAGILAHSGGDPEGAAEDPRTRLQRLLGPVGLETEFRATGPDHQQYFNATLTDRRGRRSSGNGKTKKEAVRNASKEFLRQHLARESEADRSGISPSYVRANLAAIEGADQHGRAITRIRELFQLPEHATPLLSQALIHSSWTYEHPEIAARTHQQDNQVLGLVGSHVLNYDQALRVARVVCENPPEQLTSLIMDRGPYERAFYHMGLANALLVGAGQASMGIMFEMAANAFQAVMAVIYLSKDCPASLLDDWPSQLSRLREFVIPAEPHPKDSITLLQEICSAALITADYSFKESGPDHEKRYRATLHLRSQALGRQIEAAGGSMPGKTAAKSETATIILAILDSLSEPESLAGLVETRGNDPRVATFLLAHLAAAIPGTEAGVRRWMDVGLFGTQLASNPASLVAWAYQADRLIRRQQVMKPDVDAVARLFSRAIQTNPDRGNVPRKQLRALLDWLDKVEEPEEIGEQHVSRLAQLCDLYRALGSDEPDIYLSDLLREWQVLYGKRIQVIDLVPVATLDNLQRAAIDAMATFLLRYGESIEVRAATDHRLYLQIAAETKVPQKTISEACALWSSASPLLDLFPSDRGIDSVLTLIQATDEAGPVTRAVAVALRQPAAPYSSGVADLLHDMKNQLIAARQALISPAHSRTARFAREASASGHLDQAVAIGRRLGAVSSLLGPPGSDVTELGSFIRQYGAGLLGRLPSKISLTVPPSPLEEVAVVLDEASLTAVLDNLVNNAIEVMPSGGAVRLDWTSDSAEVVIEVADSGPGLPEQVLRALGSGGRVTSTKVGGNGVGLLSVQALLRRVGGDLTAATSPSGTAWLLTVPRAMADEGETE